MYTSGCLYPYQKAMVAGYSLTGLLAARVLTQYAERVIIVAPEEPRTANDAQDDDAPTLHLRPEDWLQLEAWFPQLTPSLLLAAIAENLQTHPQVRFVSTASFRDDDAFEVRVDVTDQTGLTAWHSAKPDALVETITGAPIQNAQWLEAWLKIYASASASVKLITQPAAHATANAASGSCSRACATSCS